MFETLAEFLLLAPLALGALLGFPPGVRLSPDGAEGSGEGDSDAGDTGSESRSDPTLSDRSDSDATASNSPDSRAASDAKKYRTQRNDERRKHDELAAKYEALTKSVRQLSGDDGGGDGNVSDAEVQATVHGAQMSIVESRFEVEAMRAGFDPDKVSMLFAHAERQGLFAGIEVNVTRRDVPGMADIVADLKTEHADMLKSTNPAAPPASDAASGKDNGFKIDLDNVKTGEMTRLYKENHDEFSRIMQDAVINTGQVERRTGKGIQFTIQTGGSPLARDIIAGAKRAAKRRAGQDS